MVSKQNQNVKREMQPKNMGELQSTGRSKLLRSMHTCRQSRARQHRSTGAAGIVYMTTFRPWEVVGPPMEMAARPTLTPRDQISNYTEDELPASFSRASCRNHLQFSSLCLARRETKVRERRGCCCGSPAGYLRGICTAVLPC